jgi:lysophospholipase L1-like esterase
VTALLIIGAIAVAVIAAEIAARLYARWSGCFAFAPRWKMHQSLDPRLHPDLERQVRFEINSWGERGGPVPRGAYRVLAVGGSSCECASLDQYTTWPAMVQKILSERSDSAEIGGRPVHVGSIGKSGYTTTSVATALSKILPRYRRKLDAILIMTGASDVIKWLEAGAPDRLPNEAPLDMLYMIHPGKISGFDPRQSGLAYIALRVMLTFKTKRVVNSGATVLRTREAKRRATDIRTNVPDARIVLDNFAARFSEILDLCAAKARRVIVVHQPWFEKREYTSEELALQWIGGVKAPGGSPKTFFSEQVICALYRQLDDVESRICRERGIEQIDLMPHLPPTLETFFDLNHFTPKGSRRVAELVADTILGTESLSSGEPVAARTGD